MIPTKQHKRFLQRLKAINTAPNGAVYICPRKDYDLCLLITFELNRLDIKVTTEEFIHKDNFAEYAHQKATFIFDPSLNLEGKKRLIQSCGEHYQVRIVIQP